MKIFLALTFVLFGIVAQAQVKATIALKHTEYIQYERVALRITLTNQSGQNVELDSDPWLDIFVEKSDGSSLVPGFDIETPARTLTPNQSITFEANLTQMYDISQIGRYSIFLVASPKSLIEPVYSNRTRFEVHEPRILSTQRPAIAVNESIEYRVLHFPRYTKDYLYLQCYSIDKGRPLNTVGLGSYMADYKPTLKVDSNGAAACFFQQNQKFFVLSMLTANGVLESFEHYTRRTPNLSPSLALDNQGDIVVLGSNFYDPAEEARKARILKKLSQRPPGF